MNQCPLFVDLLDNYERVVGKPEDMSGFETNETWRFIEEISKTAPILEVHKYLANSGKAPSNTVSNRITYYHSC